MALTTLLKHLSSPSGAGYRASYRQPGHQADKEAVRRIDSILGSQEPDYDGPFSCVTPFWEEKDSPSSFRR